MKVRLRYSKSQFDEAVKFIIANHPDDVGPRYAMNSIKSDIDEMVKQFPHLLQITTESYALVADITEESLDDDENVIEISILIDPTFGKRNNVADEILDINREDS